jgi:LacI family transcriptional regulator
VDRRAPAARITLADVAAEAGVSVMTVSRVVNGRPGVGEDTRERVRHAIQSLGYRPNIVARGLRASSSRTIGLIVPDVTNPYFPEIVRGAEDVAIEHGYRLLLTNGIEDVRRETDALRTFEDHLVDGVIACSPRLENQDLYRLLERQRAAVLVNRRSDPRYAGSVRIDHELGARMLLRHVHEVGCRRPAYLSGPPHSHAGRERLLGLEREAAELGVELPADRMMPCAPTVEGGAKAAREMVERHPEVDGLLCFNDLVAAGALQALQEMGVSVPREMAVTGYDDIVFARMFAPGLTTVRAPKYELGQQAARMLLDRMNGRGYGVNIVLQPELVVRGSTVGFSPRAAQRRLDARPN